MIHVFLPAYNEEAAIEKLTDKFRQTFQEIGEPYRIVILDDGSSDKTVQVAQTLSSKYPLELLRHQRNQGLGQTMIDGLDHVAKVSADNDVVVTMDCDDTHDPRYVPEALHRLKEGYDVVILSRYQKGGGEEGLSFLRSFLSRGAAFFLKLFFPIKGVQEYSSGFRVFKASALKRAFEVFGKDFIRLPHLGFVVTPEVLIKFRMIGCRITEVPFILSYDRKKGKSKNRPLKTIAGYFALVWFYWGRRPIINSSSSF